MAVEMEKRVKLNRWGYEVNTSSDSCIYAINAYYHQVLSYGRERRVILEAPIHDKHCVLGNILTAEFLSSSDPTRANSYVQAAQSHLEQATSYEKAVYDVVSYMVSDSRDDDVAVELYSKLLKKFPKDLASLKRAQILCFYMARPDLSLDLVQQVLPANQEEDYIYGMLAFPLLELGRMAEAEEAASKGYDINKQDLWAQHCLCHVLQYECRFKEAIEFMEGCSSSWSSCSSFMYTHNWWHVALCYLESSAPMSKVLEVYDHCIWKELERPDAVYPEIYLNAVGLLLRVFIRGEFDGFADRLRILADRLKDQANWHLEWHLDVLIIWALAKTGEISSAQNLLDGLKSRTSKMHKKKQELMQKGIQLVEFLYEYGRGNDKEAVNIFWPDFDANDYKIIGASDEQIDVFNEVWCRTLLNAGQTTKAIEEIKKRIEKRDRIPFLWRLLEEGYSMECRQEAASAGQKAKTLEAAYL